MSKSSRRRALVRERASKSGDSVLGKQQNGAFQSVRCLPLLLSSFNSFLRKFWLRSLIYNGLLLVLAGFVLLRGLNEPMLSGDESIYALLTENFVASNDWFRLSVNPPAPYFHKPPLYVFLSALTHSLFPEGALAFRFWSAAFGMGCILLTYRLGRSLFTPEIGFLAGLFVLANRSFVFHHGARDGCMDAALTFCALLCCLFYERILRTSNAWKTWLALAISAGLASLFKPFMGLPILAALGVHYLCNAPTGCRAPRAKRFCLWFTISFALALPWYVLQWARFGNQFLDSFFWTNFVERATQGLDPWHLRPVWFYFADISQSSPLFLLFLPSFLFAAAVIVRRGENHDSFAFLAVIVGVFVCGLSVPVSKLGWYAYPVYPLIAITIAAALFRALRHLALALPDSLRQPAVTVAVASLAWFAFSNLITFQEIIENHQSVKYEPLLAYRAVEAALQSGEADFVCYRLSAADAPMSGIGPTDHFYLRQMTAAIWVNTPDSLQRHIQKRQAVFVLTSSQDHLREVASSLPATVPRGHCQLAAATNNFFLIAVSDARKLLQQ